jgi:hypothetical protein
MDELADTIRNAVGPDVLSDYGGDLQVVGRLNPDPTPPSIDIYPPFADQARDQDSAGFGDVVGRVILTVRVRVTTVDHDAGQNLLLRFMDEEDDLSLVHAIMDDQTLNGLAGSVYAVGPSGYTRYPDSGGDGDLLGCEWNVSLMRAYS